MKTIDFNNRKVKDPERFPKVIIPIENETKLEFKAEINKMIGDITKKMVDLKK